MALKFNNRALTKTDQVIEGISRQVAFSPTRKRRVDRESPSRPETGLIDSGVHGTGEKARNGTY